MKMNTKISVLFAFALMGITQGCNDILTEHPKNTFTNDYFGTAQGLQDGLNAAYSFLRFQYGTNPAIGLNVVGTDEFSFGPEPNYNSSGDNLPHKQLGQYTLSASHGFLLVTYTRTFPIINTLNALLDYAPNVSGMTDQARGYALAQIHYLRAHYYYFLVTQFGASPVDLGSGDFKFNTKPYHGFNKLDPDLLKKNFQGMIDDLTFASESEFMPDARPVGQFKLSKAVALHLLAKIYLFRAYSTVAESGDFQKAYDTAKKLIDGKATYGVDIQQDFGNVFKQGNDYNSEIIFAAERIPKDQLNNGYPSTGPSGIGDVENMASNCFTSNYEQALLLTPAGADPIDGRPLNYQRPLRKIAPTPWLLNQAFADKTNDSRYNNSFRTLYTIDTQNLPGSAGYIAFTDKLAAMVPVRALGDTAFYLAETDAQALAMKNKYYRVYAPSEFYTSLLYPVGTPAANQILVYPGLKKFNDAQRVSFNDASGRPMPIFRLSETYLIAAEAAFQLNNKQEAADQINIIRTRAAYRPGLDPTDLSDRITAMQVTAGQIDLDFILDERARELCGESLRWADLAMRGDDVFVNRVKLNLDASGVQTFHRLRPIPQSQLDAIDDTDKSKYQNPGYN